MTRQDQYAVPERIVSGGQTGADRGALDAAIALDIAHGGWCPRGRRAEDGPIDQRYQLQETQSSRYSDRTRQNVIDSSGTLILCRGPLQGGTELTYRLAQRFAKPCLVIDLAENASVEVVRQWLMDHDIRVLNVAGPRESSSRGIARDTFEFLMQVLGERPGTRPRFAI